MSAAHTCPSKAQNLLLKLWNCNPNDVNRMDMDDWDLSAEELDSLERDALKQIAERKSPSSSPSTSTTVTSGATSLDSGFSFHGYGPQQNLHSKPQPAAPLGRSPIDPRPTQKVNIYYY